MRHKKTFRIIFILIIIHLTCFIDNRPYYDIVITYHRQKVYYE